MSDRLYQHRTELPLDAVHPQSAADEITAAIRELEDLSENRPFPVALDWSDLVIDLGPNSDKTKLLVTASAPVL